MKIQMKNYFALNTPTIETDPDVNNLFLGLMLLILVIGLSVIVWQATPYVYRYIKKRRIERAKEANSIWYDTKESELHRGFKQIRIEPKSLEHFVCKITFSSPSRYIDDLTIFEARDAAIDHRQESQRGVEQAVRRLNKKGRELGLKNDLFRRSKEHTSVNNEYRSIIIKD